MADPAKSPAPVDTLDTLEVRSGARLSQSQRSLILSTSRETLARSLVIQERLREIGASMPTIDELAAQIVATGLKVLDATGAISARLLGDLRSGQLLPDAGAHVPPELAASLEPVAITADVPLAIAARTSTVVTCGSRAEIAERYPAFAAMLGA